MNIIQGIVEKKGTVFLDTTKHSAFVRELQALLNKKGYSAGTIDGMAGPQTLAAWARFKKDHHLKRPEDVEHSSLATLLELPDRSTVFSSRPTG